MPVKFIITNAYMHVGVYVYIYVYAYIYAPMKASAADKTELINILKYCKISAQLSVQVCKLQIHKKKFGNLIVKLFPYVHTSAAG